MSRSAGFFLRGDDLAFMSLVDPKCCPGRWWGDFGRIRFARRWPAVSGASSGGSGDTFTATENTVRAMSPTGVASALRHQSGGREAWCRPTAELRAVRRRRGARSARPKGTCPGPGSICLIPAHNRGRRRVLPARLLKNSASDVTAPMRLETHFMAAVFETHCTGRGMSRRNPVSGTDPGSKAIDETELRDLRSRRSNS